MILYFDTSALIKLYVEEIASDRVRLAVDRAEAVTTHEITYPECRAALARLHREDRLLPDDFAAAKVAFEADWGTFLRIAARGPLLRRAGSLAETFALRGFESVHLAAAEYAQLQAGETIVFACFDDRLSAAASSLGIQPLPEG